MATPCNNNPDEVVSKIVSAKANADKFDAFVNGGQTETVQLGDGDPTPTIRNAVRQILADASWARQHIADAPEGDVSLNSVTTIQTSTSRMLADRFSDVVNVKDLGAIGDGVSDDTAAFNSAPDYVPVYVPAGTYRISNPYDLGKNKRFFGLGKLVFDNAEYRRRGGSSGSTEIPEHYTLFYNYDSQSDVTVTFGGVEQTITWVDDFTVEAPGTAFGVDVRINIANGWINLGSIPEGVRGFNVFAFGGKHSVITDEPATAGSGYNNVSIGSRAMDHITSGGNNVAVGSRALLSNKTGQNNTAIGFQALYRATGDGNTAVGSVAGEWLTTGHENSFFGLGAGSKTTTGIGNTGLGYNAGQDIYTGSYNTAVGYRALGNVGYDGTQDSSTAVGAFAGDLAFGPSNTWVGYRAGAAGVLRDGTATRGSSGKENVGVGMFSMRYQNGASCNVAVGTGTATAITFGQENTILGHEAGCGLTNRKKNVFIGSHAGTVYSGTVEDGFTTDADTSANGSYSVVIGADAGRKSGGGCVYVGYNVAANATGDSNIGVGNSCLPNLTTGTQNIAIGTNAGRLHFDHTNVTTDENTVFIGYDARSSGSNQVQLGNSSQTCYAFGAVQDRSDARDKADVRDTILGLDFINALRPVDFRWDYRDDYADIAEDGTVSIAEKDGSRKRIRFHHGLIAQEVKAVLDEQGIDFGGYQDHKINGGCDVLTLGYEEFIAPMIKAIQELSVRIDILEAR